LKAAYGFKIKIKTQMQDEHNPPANALREMLRARILSSSALACLRLIAANVSATIETLSASTDLRHQHINDARSMLTTAVEHRIDMLLANLTMENNVRMSNLERQLVSVDNALNTLQQEHDAVCKVMDASTDDQLRLVCDELTQRLDAAETCINLLSTEPVETHSIQAHVDAEHALGVIRELGAVHGTHVAGNVFERGLALLVGEPDRGGDAAAAFTMFEDAAAQGNSTAMGYAAAQLSAGFGVQLDTARARRMFEEAESKGDLYSRAMVNLLSNEQSKLGIAFALFRHAASTGHVAAEHAIGVCCREGLGCDVDNTVAAKHFLRAADQGYAIAQAELAKCFLEGIGVTKDLAKAAALCRLAADRGFADAQNALGQCYKNGMGVEKDPAQTIVWLCRAADQKWAKAQFNLGLCYFCGFGVDKDPKQAVAWYRHAADQGLAPAQNSLGSALLHGTGVAKDVAEAVAWFTRAAEQGYDRAQANLGLSFYRGLGVTQDFVQAVSFFARAAEQGEPTAQYSLGVCYASGNGVEKNFSQALVWYKRAADLGYDQARQRLEKVYAAAVVAVL
jgi:TPR repeat protein